MRLVWFLLFVLRFVDSTWCLLDLFAHYQQRIILIDILIDPMQVSLEIYHILGKKPHLMSFGLFEMVEEYNRWF